MPHIPDVLNIIIVCMMGLLILLLWVGSLRHSKVGKLRDENVDLKKKVRGAITGLNVIRILHPCDNPRCSSNIAIETLKALYVGEIQKAPEWTWAERLPRPGGQASELP